MAARLKKVLWPDLKLSRKRTGVDASSEEHALVDIEFKTTQGDSFMWDKQLEEVRRQQTLASDAFVFGIFKKENLKTILVATEPATIEHIRELMREKQAERIRKWEANIAAGKRGGTDAITSKSFARLRGRCSSAATSPRVAEMPRRRPETK